MAERACVTRDEDRSDDGSWNAANRYEMEDPLVSGQKKDTAEDETELGSREPCFARVS